MHVKLFIAKINVRLMDRSLNVCKTFPDKINVRFMDRSLNACKTFHNGNQCSIYRTLIHRHKSTITFNVQFACTELQIARNVFETNGMP